MLSLLFNIYFRCLAIYLRFFLKGKDVLILDIDNTIAFTFESLISDKIISNENRLATLNPKENVIAYFENKYPKHSKIFISARSYRYYWVSYKWLKKNRLSFNLFNVILVPKAKDKLWFLNLFSKNSNVVYFDDLSYNHENGQVLYYQQVIENVNNIELIYYDYKDILEIEKHKLL
jgi:hypothetical protein